MQTLIYKYRTYFNDRDFVISFFVAFLLLSISLVVNFYAGTYATEQASNAVTDIILDNIPVIDLNSVFVYGAIFFWVFVTFLCLVEPKRIPFILKSIALFVVIRSIFIILTHIGPPVGRVLIESKLLDDVSFGGDLFFSGHVGLPYLMALIFWKDSLLRYFFITTAGIFAFVVLASRFHYSVDVLSAVFITYTIFHIARTFFKKDEEMFYIANTQQRKNWVMNYPEAEPSGY